MLTIPTLPILLILSAIMLRRDVVLPLPGFVNRFLSAMLLAPEREAQKVVMLVFILGDLRPAGAWPLFDAAWRCR